MTTPEGDRRPSVSEEEPALETHDRLSGIYLPYLKEHPVASWVMIGDKTGEVYGGGTDEQIPGEEAYEVLELAVGEKVHLFGRPVGIGLDGSMPDFS